MRGIQVAESAYRVLIVDRDSMSGDLLATALLQDGRCQASAIQPGDLMHTLAKSSVDLLVIGAELNVKFKNGLDLAHAVGRAYPHIFIVVLLDSSTSERVISAFRSGARGVFTRENSVAEFLQCIECVRKGFIWAGVQETISLLKAFRSIPSPSQMTADSLPSLTARELQVAQHAARGKTNKMIAGELRLSEHTVKNHLFRAFEKLRVSSRVELLLHVTQLGHTSGPALTGSLESGLSAE